MLTFIIEVLTIIIDQFINDPKRYVKNEFVFTVLPEKNRGLENKKEDYPCICISTDDEYYNYTNAGEMIFIKIRKKVPIIYFAF